MPKSLFPLSTLLTAIFLSGLLSVTFSVEPLRPKMTCSELHALHRLKNPDAPTTRPSIHPYIPPPPLEPLISAHERYLVSHKIGSTPLGTGKFTYGVFPLTSTSTSTSTKSPPSNHVIKVLKPTSMKRIYRELNITSTLLLPHSPRLLAVQFLSATSGLPILPNPELYNTTELDGEIVTVMHISEGEMERSGWRGGRMERCRRRLFKLICSVNDLHNLSIVHLDIKPSNFHGTTLLDYGLSTYSGLETSTKVATLNYKSPELCEDFWGEGGGEAVDVWGVGLFNGRNKVEVRKQQAKFCKRLRRGKGVDWGIQRGKKLRRRERRFLDEIEEMLGGMMKEEGGERWTMEKCANLKLFRRYRRMRRKR
ncbi:hypothetical protein TrLO_g1771 [Triparma laevis f. longispina]|uniref:Protein kinase domain-containing protein n=1 Tax=Triparma laevis f. longispina TaxID=1714387 RepID=A0A9W7KZN0_9STRA|nr:hypothetical protein TrLO_g1771 [Triparma laevis f. longispina]